MAPNKRHSRPKSLSHGRPPLASTVGRGRPPSLTSKATRSLIRTHHTLSKQYAQAVAAGDEVKAAAIKREIDAQGGLEKYQVASITGQSSERGGDSSKVLMQWLEEGGIKSLGSPSSAEVKQPSKLRMLEVGALSTNNACSKSPFLQVTRIDLHSQGPGIEQQDFMERPLPANETETFDLISLSLVLNYVPDPAGRGEMLRRTCSFLARRSHQQQPTPSQGIFTSLLPALFLVLPAPCVANSRYLTEDHLEKIMKSFGYERVHRKMTVKLIYYLFKWHGPKAMKLGAHFPKRELLPGGKRNNFAVVLK